MQRQKVILIHGLVSEEYSCAKQPVSESQSVSKLKFPLTRLFLKGEKDKVHKLFVNIQNESYKPPKPMEQHPSRAEEQGGERLKVEHSQKEKH